MKNGLCEGSPSPERMLREKPEAVRKVEINSDRNINQSRELLRDWATKRGLDAAEVDARVETATEKAQEEMVLAYYETFDDVAEILAYGGLKNLFEFSPEDQEKRKKAGDGSAQEATIKRQQVEKELGWKEEEPVYHLVAESDTDGLTIDGPSGNYGSVRFVFDFEQLADNATFTEGDSLNTGHLPDALSDKARWRTAVVPGAIGNMNYNIEKRSLAKSAVPEAYAIFKVATEIEEPSSKTPIFLRYIEAQVGGIPGTKLFDALVKIELDPLRSLSEGWSSTLRNKEKLHALSDKYFGDRKFPRFNLDVPVQKIDADALDREIADTYFEAFQKQITEIEIFCAERGIKLVLTSDIETVRSACLERIQKH